jgi:hypothetical protein
MVMARQLQAVYEKGGLRPVEPLALEEHQLVSVVILDDAPVDDELSFAPAESFSALADHAVTVDMVRRALSTIPGSLEADFAAEREDR